MWICLLFLRDPLKKWEASESLESTVPTLSSCTKCMSRQGIIHVCPLVCHPVTWAWMHGSMNDFTFIDVTDMFSKDVLQPGTDIRPVDLCRNMLSVLYTHTYATAEANV